MDSHRLTIGQQLYRIKAHHILIWTLYFVFWITFYRGYYSSLRQLTIITFVYFIFNAAGFYVTAYVLLPRFLYKRKHLSFAIWVIVTFSVASLGLAAGIYSLIKSFSPDVVLSKLTVVQIAFLSLVTTVGGLCAAKLIVEKIRTEHLNQQLENQRIETELQYLKAQVNPHFLFNAINSVYFLIQQDPKKGADALIKLSDLLRFQLYDCSGDFIPIESEISYLRNYVCLEQIRKGDQVKVNFLVQEGVTGFRIPPFLLIPFVENAFKFVSNTLNGDNRIEICIARNDRNLVARFFNTIHEVPETPGSGIGHKNVMRRLDLLYGGKHSLKIDQLPESFEAHLSLMVL